MPECMVTRLHQVIKYCELAKCHASVYFFHLCLYHGCWLLGSDLSSLCSDLSDWVLLCAMVLAVGFQQEQQLESCNWHKKELEGWVTGWGPLGLK